MGILGRFKRISDPVEGIARVVSATGAPDGQGSAACGMHLVVTVPGVPSVVVRETYLVKMSKWPWPGMELPILASRSDPTRFKIRWDRVPTGRERGAEQAARLADALNARAAGWPADGRAGTARPADGGAGQDRLDRLERLAALHRSGAVSAAEYERLKAEILNG